MQILRKDEQLKKYRRIFHAAVKNEPWRQQKQRQSCRERAVYSGAFRLSTMLMPESFGRITRATMALNSSVSTAA